MCYYQNRGWNLHLKNSLKHRKERGSLMKKIITILILVLVSITCFAEMPLPRIESVEIDGDDIIVTGDALDGFFLACTLQWSTNMFDWLQASFEDKSLNSIRYIGGGEFQYILNDDNIVDYRNVFFRFARNPADIDEQICTVTNNLSVGSRSMEVVILQHWLEFHGYLTIPMGFSVGVFDELTQSALSDWQSDQNITPAEGTFDSITRETVCAITKPAIELLRVESGIMTYPEANIGIFSFVIEITNLDSNDDIYIPSDFQQHLGVLNYTSANLGEVYASIEAEGPDSGDAENHFVVEVGGTREFTVTIAVEVDSVDEAGLHQVVIEGVNWSKSTDLQPLNLARLYDPFETDWKYISSP